MTKLVVPVVLWMSVFAIGLSIPGCGGSSESESSDVDIPDGLSEIENAKPSNSAAARNASKLSAADRNRERVQQALNPWQMMLGGWRGTTHKKIGGFSSVETVEWVWDFLSDKTTPTLVMTAENSPYFQTGRLTYLVEEEKFQFTAVDKEGLERVYQGTNSKPAPHAAGTNNEPKSVHRLHLIQVSPALPERLAEIMFIITDDNQYLLEVFDKRDGRTVPLDTIGNQREETAFAVNGTDEVAGTCLISRRRGHLPVRYQGRSYVVCCSGCQAAFEKEPDRWLARLSRLDANRDVKRR